MCSYLDEDHCKRLGAGFQGPASPSHDLPICSETAPSAEPQSSGPYIEFRDHALGEADEDLLQASSVFDRQSRLQQAQAAVWDSRPNARDQSLEPPSHLRTIDVCLLIELRPAEKERALVGSYQTHRKF